MSRVDVALFLPSLRGGGAERVMVNLARGFVDRGLRVYLVLAKAEGPHLSQVPDTVRVIDLGSPRVLYSLPGLVRYLRRERPQAMLSTLSHANIVALWAKRLAHVPIRVVVREAIMVSENVKYARSLNGKWMLFFIRMFYHWANVVVANSYDSAKDLAQVANMPFEKIKVIYNPVALPELLAKAEEPLEHPWFQAGEPPVVLGVGRLTKQKDFLTLIKAFALVRRKHRARLMILGEGEERSNLEVLVRELGLVNDVALPGFVDNPYKYMKRAAVFVLSSRWEGLPNALIEALALGTPIVATDCPSGPFEILEHGKWGKLVPVGDPEALARGILETLASPPNSEDLQERARAFSLEAILPQYLEVLGIEESK